MKTRKKNSLLIILVVLLLALAVGYAAFQQILTVTGTATANGKWDVKFVDPTTISSGHGTATKTADDTVTVAATLAFPGDACEVTVTIQNSGTVAAKLTSLDVLEQGKNTVFSDSDIKITLPDNVAGETLAAGQKCTFTFTIAWDADSTLNTVKTASFDIKFTYDQATTAPTVNTNHPAHANVA